jgi:hypothetical protein
MRTRCKAVRVVGPWRGWQCGTPAARCMDGYCGVHFGQLCADPGAFKERQRKATLAADRAALRRSAK